MNGSQRFMGRAVSAAVLLGSVFAIAAAPAGFTLKSGTSQVAFEAKGPGGLKIEGKSTELSVKDEGEKLRVVVPLAKLDTGIELRNQHMRDKYLETGKHPTAELVVDKKDALAKPSGTLTGQLTLHGVTKPVSIQYTWTQNGAHYDVKGSGALKLDDFGITQPGYLGVTVSKDIGFRLSFGLEASGGQAS